MRSTREELIRRGILKDEEQQVPSTAGPVGGDTGENSGERIYLELANTHYGSMCLRERQLELIACIMAIVNGVLVTNIVVTCYSLVGIFSFPCFTIA